MITFCVPFSFKPIGHLERNGQWCAYQSISTHWRIFSIELKKIKKLNKAKVTIPVCGTGFALSSLLATNVSSMIALYGFMAGSGLGLMYVPTIISVNYYFDKKRSIANGE